MNTEEERAHRRQDVHLALDAYQRAARKVEIVERYHTLHGGKGWSERYAAYARASKAAQDLSVAAQHEADLLSQEAASCVPEGLEPT